MTELERGELESRADRCLRRGELGEALAVFQSLTAAFPEDAALLAKLSTVRESLQPAELMSPKANFAREPVLSGAVATEEQEGERLFALGDTAGAAAAYRRALEKKPDSELIRERLEELYRLARTAGPGPAPAGTSAAPIAQAAGGAAPPEGPSGLLEILLGRVRARRRT